MTMTRNGRRAVGDVRVEPQGNTMTAAQYREMVRDLPNVIRDTLKGMGYTPEQVRRVPLTPDGRSAARAGDDGLNAPGAELNGMFRRFGEFLLAVAKGGNAPGLKALQDAGGNSGGFLVPEEYRADLLSDVLEDAVIRPYARVIPMGSPTLVIPRLNVTTHAGSVFGGVVAYWEKEGADLSQQESEPSFGQVRFEAHSLIGWTVASNLLLADSAISLEPLLTTIFGEALRFYEESSYVNGNAVGEPMGINNSPALAVVAAEAGQQAATFNYQNAVKMYATLLPRSMRRARWLAHPNLLPQLLQMSLAVGTGGSIVWIGNNGGAADAPPVTIFGRPVDFSEHCQTLGTQGDILLYDPSFYVIADRQALSIAASEHVKFQNNQTVWRFIQRLDAQPWLNSSITPEHGTSAMSPFVALATRS